MNYHVTHAKAIDNSMLYLEFQDGRHGIYDMSPLIGKDVFAKLSNPSEFAAVRSDGFTAVWQCGVDIAPEELYENCVAP